MTICIIENDAAIHEQLCLDLQHRYKRGKVIPPYDQPTRNWIDAIKLVESTQKKGQIVFILDLALDGSEPKDADRGIEQCIRIRRLRPNAVMIAATSFAPRIEQQFSGNGVFDDVLDKQQNLWQRPEELVAYICKSIDAALRRRSGAAEAAPAPLEFTFEDSLQFRLAEAVLGPRGLEALIAEEMSDWEKLSVRALSAGLSGSHLLAFRGRKSGHRTQLLIKVAASRKILEDEVERPKQFEFQLDQFTGHVNFPGDEIHPLPEHRVFYHLQAVVAGSPLLSLFKKGPKSAADAILGDLLQLLIQQYRNASQDRGSVVPQLGEVFAFRPNHLHRVHDACDRLGRMANRLEELGQWPASVGATPEMVFGAVRQIADHWSEHLATIKVPFWAIQHGDLHPGNVIENAGQFSFIDFARLGPWPVGYDISRLATLSRLILPHHQGDEDHLINHIESWAKEPFAKFDNRIRTNLCAVADKCDKVFLRFVGGQADEERTALARTYQFCTLSDLLRMISYSTFSPFKRIWIAIACWQLGKSLGLIPRKEE